MGNTFRLEKRPSQLRRPSKSLLSDVKNSFTMLSRPPVNMLIPIKQTSIPPKRSTAIIPFSPRSFLMYEPQRTAIKEGSKRRLQLQRRAMVCQSRARSHNGCDRTRTCDDRNRQRNHHRLCRQLFLRALRLRKIIVSEIQEEENPSGHSDNSREIPSTLRIQSPKNVNISKITSAMIISRVMMRSCRF